jgi:hypothetical protein
VTFGRQPCNNAVRLQNAREQVSHGHALEPLRDPRHRLALLEIHLRYAFMSRLDHLLNLLRRRDFVEHVSDQLGIAGLNAIEQIDQRPAQGQPCLAGVAYQHHLGGVGSEEVVLASRIFFGRLKSETTRTEILSFLELAAFVGTLPPHKEPTVRPNDAPIISRRRHPSCFGSLTPEGIG